MSTPNPLDIRQTAVRPLSNIAERQPSYAIAFARANMRFSTFRGRRSAMPGAKPACVPRYPDWWGCASAADRVWAVFVRTNRSSHKAKSKEHPGQYDQRANDEDPGRESS